MTTLLRKFKSSHSKWLIVFFLTGKGFNIEAKIIQKLCKRLYRVCQKEWRGVLVA
jgi:hypothetical protein